MSVDFSHYIENKHIVSFSESDDSSAHTSPEILFRFPPSSDPPPSEVCDFCLPLGGKLYKLTDEENEDGEDEDEEDEEEDEDASGSEDDEDEDDDDEDDSNATGSEDDEDEDEDDEEEEFNVNNWQQRKLKKLIKQYDNTVNEQMPHKIECPSNIEDFYALIDKYVNSFIDTKALLDRILAWNSVHLPGAQGQTNKNLMHNFLDILLKHFVKLYVNHYRLFKLLV
jgi:hypothetical protein